MAERAHPTLAEVYVYLSGRDPLPDGLTATEKQHITDVLMWGETDIPPTTRAVEILAGYGFVLDETSKSETENGDGHG